ncbi:fumarylacetoacetase [Ornithinicoccus halotolerans]|uniref:fumarylacetoacetase n=1 Tax=Ornithinicoccus halotolerans TaxID=1748220 RepID=UPI001296809F|nr:fumarylacetoacetase [Ornithinicoccus halotolerans]
MTDPSWLDLAPDDPYGVHHLPYGVVSTSADTGPPHVVVRAGDLVLDLGALARQERLRWAEALSEPTLNAFLGAGPEAWASTRDWLQELLTDPAAADRVRPHLNPLDQAVPHLPLRVADYVDFYASEHHASNVGRIFRPDGEPLTPNWKHLPIGYHGRSSTVVVSGTDVVRPRGQRKAPADPAPSFGPSTKLDIEAEVGFVIGAATPLGSSVPVAEAGDHLFGVTLVNDWSARDIQAWEYVPLGPFLGKSFATSVAAWITPMAALAHARVPLPEQDPRPLDYLLPAACTDTHPPLQGLDLTLEVRLNGSVIARPPYRTMYWSPEQLLAHLTVNGAALSDGDLIASGTVSGPERDQRGSLLELTWNGTEPLALPDGSSRGFLEDGDVVTIAATAPGPGGAPIALAEVSGRVRPAPES